MSVITLPKNPAASLRDLGRLQDIPAVRQLGLFALVAAVIALGLWLFFWTQKPDYMPVFAGLDAKSTSDASELLRTAKIPFRIDAGTGALAVPQDQAGAAKMALAAAGLPANNRQGFETMEQDQGFGTSQFVENARYQHALEIELARTIADLRPVREARVHLALPKPSAFTRQREPATASVVLQLQTGSVLEQGQVDAIVHLVASSISDLAPERVTVVDQFGRMLSNPDPDSEAAIGAKQFDQQRRLESVYVQRIQELLEPMTGPGRVSARVSVDMDFAQTEEARETYAPDPAKVRSEQISESGNLAALSAPPRGVPGSASNTPVPATPAGASTDAATLAGAANATPAPAPAPAAAPTGNGARSSVRNYELDRTLTHTRQAPGRVRRVTAAVLVDNVPVTAADGKTSQRALGTVEVKRIETLVQQAIGFEAERGDVVSVVNAPFARDAVDGPADGPPLWDNPRVRDLLRTALGGLAVLMLIWVVLRPAFRQLLAPKPATATSLTALVDDDQVTAQARPMPASPTLVPKPVSGFETKLETARTAVSNDPKRVAQVMRDWVATDG